MNISTVVMDSGTPSNESCSASSGSSDCGDILGYAPLNVRNICFVGAGYVGGPTASVLALQHPDIHVTVVDRDIQKINKWNSKHLPVHEPGLERIVSITRDGTNEVSPFESSTSTTPKITSREPNLFFSTAVEETLAIADLVFIAVNTPTKTTGLGSGSATNLAAFESAVTTIAQHAKPGCIIVEKSTVPCGTAQIVRKILAVYRPNDDIEVLSNPEFLAEGTAVRDLLYPDRVLIGSSTSRRGLSAADSLKTIFSTWVDPSRILTVNVWSSELAKLVANAMLAQRISSINTISAICDKTGANIDEVAMAIGLDKRIGDKFLKAGLGFGGSCFKKDILSLAYLSRSLHLPEVADYWMSVLSVNEFQRNRFMQNVVNRLHGALFGKKITVLGFTFKQDTNDTRESPAVDVIRELLSECPAEIAVFDPGCSPAEIRSHVGSLSSFTGMDVLKPKGAVQAYDNAYEACKGASAVLILTAWNQFVYPPKPVQTKIVPSKAIDMSLLSSGEFLNELDILVLEQSLQSTPMVEHTDNGNTPDPLKRLRPQPQCSEGCESCLSAATPKRVKVTAPIEWEKIAPTMREPKWVFDGRNLVDCNAMSLLGFRVEGLGKSSHASF